MAESNPRYTSTPRGEVPIEFQGRGEWLADAALHLGDAASMEAYRSAADDFHKLGEGETVESVGLECPEDEVKDQLNGPQRAAWMLCQSYKRTLQNNLTFRLHNGSLFAFGYRQRAREAREYDAPVWISHLAWWNDLKVVRGERNVVHGEGVNYRYVRVIDTREVLISPNSEAALCDAETALPKRGPIPVTRPAVEIAMRGAIASGRITVAALKTMQKKRMPELFGGSDTTCYEARKSVLRTLTNSDK